MTAAANGSTKGKLREAYADVAKCASCRYFKANGLFTLCEHSDAEYHVAGKTDQHTIQHMRDVNTGLCGEEAKLWEQW